MRCPKCHKAEDKVIDSRPLKEGAVIRRRRQCIGCGSRFTTYETIEREDLRVIKRDGRYEAFDRSKLCSGMIKACEKRPVSPESIEKCIDQLVEDLEKRFGTEIPTTEIGEAIMRRLRVLDDVAYVRFASVYRQFKDINEFVAEIQNMSVD